MFDAGTLTTTLMSHSISHSLQDPRCFQILDQILLEFRLYPVTLSADISKMYRAVELDVKDQDLHRFLWRPDPKLPIAGYRMTRVTFGVSPSPFLSDKALKQTTADFGHEYPCINNHVTESFYVDDFLADTPAEALQLQFELRSLLLRRGFDLHKWRSNAQEVLDQIQPELLETVPVKSLVDDPTSTHPKSLGMVWNALNNTLFVSLEISLAFIQERGDF